MRTLETVCRLAFVALRRPDSNRAGKWLLAATVLFLAVHLLVAWKRGSL